MGVARFPGTGPDALELPVTMTFFLLFLATEFCCTSGAGPSIKSNTYGGADDDRYVNVSSAAGGVVGGWPGIGIGFTFDRASPISSSS